jgi:hypothetical protein
MGGEGHIIPYHQAVEQAIASLGWHYHAIAPQEPTIAHFPDSWLAALPATQLELEGSLREKLLRMKEAITLGFAMSSALNAVIQPQSSTIIFLERFIHLQLLALWVALWRVPVANLSVWLLYRRDTHQDKTRGIYKWLNQQIAKKLGGDRLKLLTDSELLAQSLSNFFEQPVTVMPIPHTEVLESGDYRSRSPYLLCWWAGSPRLEKGWEQIRELVAAKTELADRLCLLAAESANLKVSEGGLSVKLIPDNLSRADYIYWLGFCDVILLPYDAESYRERTSGIFTECIIAGKLPVVTPETWMARELADYDLKDLAISWKNPEVAIAQILQLAEDRQIRDRLKQMQSAYQKQHNVASFAEQLKKLHYLSAHA